LHIAASVGYFIEYIMMHGTLNIKFHEVARKSGKVQKQSKDTYLKIRGYKILPCHAAKSVLEFLNYNTFIILS